MPAPEGFPRFASGEQVLLFLYPQATKTGLRTTSGLIQGSSPWVRVRRERHGQRRALPQREPRSGLRSRRATSGCSRPQSGRHEPRRFPELRAAGRQRTLGRIRPPGVARHGADDEERVLAAASDLRRWRPRPARAAPPHLRLQRTASLTPGTCVNWPKASKCRSTRIWARSAFWTTTQAVGLVSLAASPVVERQHLQLQGRARRRFLLRPGSGRHQCREHHLGHRRAATAAGSTSSTTATAPFSRTTSEFRQTLVLGITEIEWVANDSPEILEAWMVLSGPEIRVERSQRDRLRRES